jgi:hypothetical protein
MESSPNGGWAAFGSHRSLGSGGARGASNSLRSAALGRSVFIEPWLARQTAIPGWAGLLRSTRSLSLVFCLLFLLTSSLTT